MKRIITSLAVFILATHLFWGCESVIEPGSMALTGIQQKAHIIEFPGNLDQTVQAAVLEGGSPTFTDTLTNNTIVEIYGSAITDEAITIAFNYTVVNGVPVSRILQISQSLEYMVLYDVSGVPISGYVFSGGSSGGYEVTIFSGGNSFGIAHNEPVDATLTVEVLYDGQLSRAVFADEAEFDAAMALYRAIYHEGYNRELLTPAELELLDRIESISVWNDIDPQQQTDIETAANLALDSDFQNFSNAGYSTEQPINAFPWWLNAACKIVKILKYVCELAGGGEVCKWIEVLEMICDFLKEVIK